MSGGRRSRPGGRDLKQRVRTARGRKSASTRWLQRQINDPYVAAAKAQGYRSRAAFKLIELDEAHGLLRPGLRVVDLGAAPGGWSQIAADRTGSTDDDSAVAAIDVLDMDAIPGVRFVQMDFTDTDAPERLRDMLGGPADVVLSDMAPNTTGHRQTDHLRIMALCELAADFAFDVLKPGGVFLAKTRQGGTEADLLALLKQRFKTVKHVKPEASRADSAELYLLATGFRG